MRVESVWKVVSASSVLAVASLGLVKSKQFLLSGNLPTDYIFFGNSSFRNCSWSETFITIDIFVFSWLTQLAGIPSLLRRISGSFIVFWVSTLERQSQISCRLCFFHLVKKWGFGLASIQKTSKPDQVACISKHWNQFGKAGRKTMFHTQLPWQEIQKETLIYHYFI